MARASARSVAGAVPESLFGKQAESLLVARESVEQAAPKSVGQQLGSLLGSNSRVGEAARKFVAEEAGGLLGLESL